MASIFQLGTPCSRAQLRQASRGLLAQAHQSKTKARRRSIALFPNDRTSSSPPCSWQSCRLASSTVSFSPSPRSSLPTRSFSTTRSNLASSPSDLPSESLNPSSLTHFQLFSLPHTFTIDPKSLRSAFLKWQSRVHPDRIAALAEQQAEESGGGLTRDEVERRLGSWSSRVNEAYKVLGSDLSRAEYLLSLLGIEISESDSVQDPELLMSILETREALEEAGTEEEVADIRSKNRDEIDETVSLLNSEFSKLPSSSLPSAPADSDVSSSRRSWGQFDPEKARDLVIRLRYLDNVEGVCREWQPGKRIELQH